ncbi:hypothetical protein PF008_g26732 [Phytophthora fragariae]|uniref:Uncharacterized protein n=1 Tax=Phytophthora fragariae TaxID=53985 RepID=A0A6G0QGC7_9STRA|nr:hypothetical protein PF008_g26732 [Phytophthora fragariae]
MHCYRQNVVEHHDHSRDHPATAHAAASAAPHYAQLGTLATAGAATVAQSFLVVRAVANHHAIQQVAVHLDSLPAMEIRSARRVATYYANAGMESQHASSFSVDLLRQSRGCDRLRSRPSTGNRLLQRPRGGDRLRPRPRGGDRLSSASTHWRSVASTFTHWRPLTSTTLNTRVHIVVPRHRMTPSWSILLAP